MIFASCIQGKDAVLYPALFAQAVSLLANYPVEAHGELRALRLRPFEARVYRIGGD